MSNPKQGRAKEAERRERKEALTGRLCDLIEIAGGQAAFCRKVWSQDDDPVGMNKSKVFKWAAGDSGISADEAAEVAAAFGRRPAWLLFGEQPEKVGLTQSKADLETDLAKWVADELAREFPMYGWYVTGPAVLSAAVNAAMAEALDAVIAMRSREPILRELDAIAEATEQFARAAAKARGSHKQAILALSKNVTAIQAALQARLNEADNLVPSSDLAYLVRSPVPAGEGTAAAERDESILRNLNDAMGAATGTPTCSTSGE